MHHYLQEVKERIVAMGFETHKHRVDRIKELREVIGAAEEQIKWLEWSLNKGAKPDGGFQTLVNVNIEKEGDD